MARGTEHDQIRAKRRAVSTKRLKERIAAGETISPETRGLVRMGQVSTRILTGMEDLSVWSDEELIRGKRRDKNGGWQGKMPVVVPLAVHQELTKRRLQEAQDLLRESVVDAIKMLVDVMKGKDTENKDRLKAIEMITNRVMGKEPTRLEVAIEKTTLDQDLEDITVIYEEDDLDPDDVA